jgi:hypothetical protein
MYISIFLLLRWQERVLVYSFEFCSKDCSGSILSQRLKSESIPDRNRRVDRPAGRQTRQTNRQAGIWAKKADRLSGRQAERQTDRPPSTHTRTDGRMTDRQTRRLADRQTDGWKDGQAAIQENKQAGKLADRQTVTDRHTEKSFIRKKNRTVF